MLEQLIESKNQNETKGIGGFLLTTFVLVVMLALSGVLWSLFAKDIAMGSDEFALSSLIAPVPMPETAPPAPAPKQPKNLPQTADNVPTRQTNTLRIDESPIAPEKLSTVPNTQKERPVGRFLVSNRTETNFGSSSADSSDRGTSNDNSIGGIGKSKDVPTEIVKTTPPPPMPTAVKKDLPMVKVPPVLSTGVINGKATYLPKPSYPAAATSLNIQGEVNVQVLIDETGKVISAKAISGHPLLKTVSETAARSAKFSPTLLSNQPVKVSGIIVYKFTK